MAFDTYEEGQQTSRPVELYTFTIGAVVTRVTTAEDAVTVAADTWQPEEGLKRSRLEGGGPDVRNRNLVLEMSGAHPIPAQYINSVPGTAGTVLIQRLQRADNSTATIFEGKIQSVAFENEGRRAKINVEPLISAVSRTIPRITYQSLCNHVLYDDACGVDDTSASFRLSAAVVTAVSGNTITVTGASANGDDFYTGGFVETPSGDDKRVILDQTGEVLTLSLPFTMSPLGSMVTVLAGCDHTIATCDTKFSNVTKFGGFSYVPTRNIFQVGLIQ